MNLICMHRLYHPIDFLPFHRNIWMNMTRWMNLGHPKVKDQALLETTHGIILSCKGTQRHWVMDDNLDAFHYLNRNIKEPVRTGVIFTSAEDFINRYDNVPLAGFNYYSFCKTTDKVPPFVHNTRIYSCLLIDNSMDIRWRGRYNEDTDLSLRVLKSGKCTIQFNTFLCGKVTTQRMSGGNTKEFYDEEGTLPKSQMLVDMHPDCAKLVWKFNRWHHQVDYSKFKGAEPHRITDEVFPKINNYGLTLVKRK